MSLRAHSTGLALGVMVGLGAGGVRTSAQATFTADIASPVAVRGEARAEREALVLRLIRHWPRRSRRVAVAVMEKYGPPHMITHKSLLWIGNSPWKATVVYRAGAFGAARGKRRRALRQVIAYRVPAGKSSELERLGMGLAADSVQEELAAENDGEAENFLALNLADQVAVSGLSVDRAKDLFARTRSLEASGKKSPLTSGLVFASRASFGP